MVWVSLFFLNIPKISTPEDQTLLCEICNSRIYPNYITDLRFMNTLNKFPNKDVKQSSENKQQKKPSIQNRRLFLYDVPGEIRTPDRRLRRALLYPAELLGLNILLIQN